MIKHLYEDGECPDCGDPIPDNAVEGDNCGNCEHVFSSTNTNFEVMDDTWWEKLEKRIAERTWLDNIYWWCYRHIRDTYHFWRRAPRRIKQYIKRGFDDEQLWSLDWTIAKFVAPRLKRLKVMKMGHPVIEADNKLCLGCPIFITFKRFR